MFKSHSKKLACLLVSMLTVSFSFIGNSPVLAATNKTFSVVTLNVAGLPGIISSSDPTVNTVKMSPLLNDYDVVAVQEDFAYHNQLISKVTSPYLTETSGNVPFGSGMNFISKKPFNDTERTNWNKSYGLLDCGSDQMTKKGFMYSQFILEPGVYVDIYTLHADADTDPKSEEARRDNLSQLAEYINANSAGHAVVVMGDTNCRYTRAEDDLQNLLVNKCGLTDTWIKLVRNGNIPTAGDALMDKTNPNGPGNEVVDKIFYRSGKAVTLNAISHRLETTKFVDEKGVQLSDHYPVTVTFEYTKNPTINMGELWGGQGGQAFNFLRSNSPITSRPTEISLSAGSRVDNISMTYADGTVLSNGGTGGTKQTLKLASDEYVTQVTLYKDKKDSSGTRRIFYAEFKTNKGRTLSGGTKSGEAATLTAPSGYYVAGFFGRAQVEVDKLGLISRPLPLPTK